MSGDRAVPTTSTPTEVDVAFAIRRICAPKPNGLCARALRPIAIAVLAVGLHVCPLAAASPSPEDTRPLGAPNAVVMAAGDLASPDVPPQEDDGEDRFDEGDDEFDCPNGDEDECQGEDADDPQDEESGSCADYDDGEDRCLDDGEDQLDEGDDEFETGCANFDDGEDRCLDAGSDRADRPAPTRAAAATTQAGTLSDPTDLAALAALATLGAGSVWFLRKAHR